MTETLVVATGNRGKLDELRALLAGLPLCVLGVSDALRDPPKVIEDGATFADNAIKKALAVANATHMLTLADDSGLEVDALEGLPGVRSARFAHEHATDAENNAALLMALAERANVLGVDGAGNATGRAKRAKREKRENGFPARFRCVLALVAVPTGRAAARAGERALGCAVECIVEGVCEGEVIREPRGAGGFGYDPLFVVAGTDKTMAELADVEKNRISHRARAFAALRPVLAARVGGRAPAYNAGSPSRSPR